MPIYASNKKATFDYEILQKYEAGIVLSGPEVKSVRNRQINLNGSFVAFFENEAYLTNAHISKYKYTTQINYEPERSRKLLLNKKELDYLKEKKLVSGLTIVPLSVYTSGRKIKLQIAVAKGKKLHDKRHAIKERETKRDMRRALKQYV